MQPRPGQVLAIVLILGFAGATSWIMLRDARSTTNTEAPPVVAVPAPDASVVVVVDAPYDDAKDDLLIEKLRARLGVAETSMPPATNEEVDAAEKELGFPLPKLLRRLLTEVGNGGPHLAGGLCSVPSSRGTWCWDAGRTMTELTKATNHPLLHTEPLAHAVFLMHDYDFTYWLDLSGGGDGEILIETKSAQFHRTHVGFHQWCTWTWDERMEQMFDRGPPKGKHGLSGQMITTYIPRGPVFFDAFDAGP